jgi:hypothetical protein
MATVKSKVGSRTTLTTSALNSLVNNTYVSAGTITFISSTLVSLTSKIEVEVTPGTVTAGNAGVIVFARISMDGTNFTTGPVSGTTSTDEPNLIYVGTVPCNTSSTLQRGNFDLALACGGTLPYAAQIVVRNTTGANLASSGHAVYYTNVDGDVT